MTPVTMKSILGQQPALDTLQASLRSNRIHHAWIFHGQPGIGKMTTALAFAAVLLDPHAQPDLTGHIDTDPQGHTATQIKSQTHPNLHIVTKELAIYSRDQETRGRKQKTIPVEVIREFLTEPASRTASGTAESKGRATKIFIVDEAERLAETSQNTLLKTLEEPPPGTVIILITANEDRLYPTIRSRCQRVTFSPLSPQEMSIWFESQDQPLDPPTQKTLQRIADGSPGRADMILQWNLMSWHETIVLGLSEIENNRFPTDLAQTLGSQFDSFAKAVVKKDENASKDAANKTAIRFMLTLMAGEIRHRLHTAVANDQPTNQYLAMIESIQQAENHMNRNVNPRLLIENLIIQWSASYDRAIQPPPQTWFTSNSPV